MYRVPKLSVIISITSIVWFQARRGNISNEERPDKATFVTYSNKFADRRATHVH